MSRPGTRLVFGYEEALGYEVGDAVSDKDGMSAGLVAAALAARAKAEGSSLPRPAGRAASRYGVHATSQWSLRLSGSEAQAEMAGIVGRWRHDPPRALAGLAVTEIVDLFGRHGRALPPRRPRAPARKGGPRRAAAESGTEPKLKAYLEVATAPVPAPDTSGRGAAPNGGAPWRSRGDVAARCRSTWTSR